MCPTCFSCQLQAGSIIVPGPTKPVVGSPHASGNTPCIWLVGADRVDELDRDLLDLAGVHEPPVDALAVAGALNLEGIYRTAAHELILMNLPRLPWLALVTVCDRGRFIGRFGNGALRPPPPLPIERKSFQRVHSTGLPSDIRDDFVRV